MSIARWWLELVDNVASSHVPYCVSLISHFVASRGYRFYVIDLQAREEVHSCYAQFSACLPVCATFPRSLTSCYLGCRCGAQAPRGASHSTDLSSPAVRMLGIFCLAQSFVFCLLEHFYLNFPLKRIISRYFIRPQTKGRNVQGIST